MERDAAVVEGLEHEGMAGEDGEENEVVNVVVVAQVVAGDARWMVAWLEWRGVRGDSDTLSGVDDMDTSDRDAHLVGVEADLREGNERSG